MSYRFIRCNNPSQVMVMLPLLRKGGHSRSVTFVPGEIKKIHEADVRSKSFQRLLRSRVMIDVTTLEERRMTRERELQSATLNKSQPVADSTETK